MPTVLMKVILQFFNVSEFKHNDANLLNTALLERKDVYHIKGLIELGAKTTCTTNIGSSRNKLMHVTPMHIAIYNGDPKALLCLLRANDINDSITMKCIDIDDNKMNCLRFALSRALRDENMIKVSQNKGSFQISYS